MKVDIIMPKMGESVNEGTIIKWHKKQGEQVKKDEILFEISTDKVDTEIPSPVDGILTDIKVFENETVEVDTVVAEVETDVKETVGNVPKKTPEKKELEPTHENALSNKNTIVSLIDIPMPKMGESVVEGTIIKWHKKVGENIKKDEILFEISTDKVDTEVPSPVEGTLAEILVNEQETVEVGTIVAKVTSKTGEYIGQEVKVEAEPIPTKIKREEPVSVQREIADSNIKTSDDGYEEHDEISEEKGSKFYSPLVLNIAQKEKVTFEELESIPGSGIGGRVTKNDIMNYLANRPKETQVKEKSKAPKPSPVENHKKETFQQTKVTQTVSGPSNSIETIPMDNIRQRIMHHMVQSRDTSVHVSGIVEVDMTKIQNFIKNNKEDFLKRENIKLTFMPFIAYACIKALKEHPYVNSSIDGTNIVTKKYINLGFAVALEPNGLIVPNIKNADEKNIRGLAKSINELSDKARNKGLTPDDISNGTFTITNYGVFGTLFGTPIINQPEVAILGVGTVSKKPVVIEVDGSDTIAIRSMMYLSLSHDHRLIDGMAGGKFLKVIKDTLENFDTSNV